MLVFDMVIAWGLARCADAPRAGPAGIALIVCGMSAATLGSYINLVHAFEAALICHALAEHAGGRRPRALALLTVALFAKPVMPYVYGLLLVILIVRDGGIRGLVRAAVPAAVVGALLAIGLVAWFGVEPVVHTLLPIRGANSYKTLNYGFFFGRGRAFWLPEGVRPRHYIFTPAGHYLVGSIILAAAAVASVWRLVRGLASKDDLNAEVVACCGIMHVVFLTAFYGNFMSFTYYYYILIIGMVAISARGPRRALVIALVAAMALLGNKDTFNWVGLVWRASSPSAETFGLWSDADYREEWRQVRRIIGDRRGSFIGAGGCMEMYLPQFGPAEDVFLVPGWPLPAEYDRKIRQIADAEVLLVRIFNKPPRSPQLPPPFGEIFKGYDLVWSGDVYSIYEHRRPRASRGAEPARGAAGAGARFLPWRSRPRSRASAGRRSLRGPGRTPATRADPARATVGPIRSPPGGRPMNRTGAFGLLSCWGSCRGIRAGRGVEFASMPTRSRPERSWSFSTKEARPLPTPESGAPAATISMKVVILAGGLGTRLTEETETRPKPMVEIGGRPILWHIMKLYAHYGFREFVVALGYKGDVIKRYFLDYAKLQSNFTVNLGSGDVMRRGSQVEDWTVHLVDTGSATNTGGRLKRLAPVLGRETFMATYGDGVADVDINALVKFHRGHGKLATTTAVRPPARFGGLVFDGDRIAEFTEKPQIGEGWINGGFFVLEPDVLEYIADDQTSWEREPMERLANEGQLMAYRHGEFWQCMDTLRDLRLLEGLWSSGQAPWKVWET